MLVLTRTCDQEIRIGDDIVVRVLHVKGDRVRIGVQAPPEVSVHRQEVYLEIMNANRESLDVDTKGLERAHELLREGAAGQSAGPKRVVAMNYANEGSKKNRKPDGREATHGTQD